MRHNNRNITIKLLKFTKYWQSTCVIQMSHYYHFVLIDRFDGLVDHIHSITKTEKSFRFMGEIKEKKKINKM